MRAAEEVVKKHFLKRSKADYFEEKGWNLHAQMAICITFLLIHIAYTVVTRFDSEINQNKISMLPYYSSLIMAILMTIFYAFFIGFNFHEESSF